MNIIIVGCGKVGQKIIQKLSFEKVNNITIVDPRSKIVNMLINQYDIMGVVGSGASLDTLLESGVKNADILIAVTGSDEINLLTCLIARKTGHCQTIARVRKPEYSKEISLFKEDLGLAMVINPEYAAAVEIARILRFPAAINIDTFAKGRVEILKFRIPENSPLDNMKIADVIPSLNCDVLVCGVERDDTAIIPHGDFHLKSGDFISVVVSLRNEDKFFRKIHVTSHKVKNAAIVGGGNTAFYLANQLLQSGIDVTIIEQNKERCEELCELLPKATIVHGDGTDNQLLIEEGIENYDSFVSLTNLEEENIILSMFAKTFVKGKIITKINRDIYDTLINGLDMGTLIYPKNITAEYIVRFVRAMHNSMGSNIETMHTILNGKAEAVEFMISENSPIANTEISELRLKKDMLIACINRNGKVIIPRGSDTILPKDTVIIVTTNTGLSDISDILEPA